MTYFRHAAVAAALLAGVGSASAQTTVITTEPAPRTVVTTQPLELTPVQRQTIYRTIVREPVEVAPPPTIEYRVGTRIPAETRLYAVPQDVAVEVPAVRRYKYMRVNNRVVLVDPATSEVVADFND